MMVHKRLVLAIAVTALSTGGAPAQSVLERVLGQVDNATNLAQVNGTFANISENATETLFTPGEPASLAGLEDANGEEVLLYFEVASDLVPITVGDIGEIVPEPNGMTSIRVNEDGSIEIIDANSAANYYSLYNANRDLIGQFSETQNLTPFNFSEVGIYEFEGARILAPSSVAANGDWIPVMIGGRDPVIDIRSADIDGSITNIVTGIEGATQQALAGVDVSAIEWDMPTLDFGDMATTALGAVNTGDITLGVNAAIDEASTSTTNAISAVMTQIGGAADTGAIVINVASNMSGVNGSIRNTMAQVNSTTGSLSTTALGAVNTGTIVSGIDGVITGITGATSGR